MALEATASSGSRLDPVLDPLHEEDVLDLDYGEDEDAASNLLVSEDGEKDDIFVTPAQASQPVASIASRDEDDSSMPASSSPSSDILNVCKRAAARLAVP